MADNEPIDYTIDDRRRDKIFWNALSTLRRMVGTVFGQSPDGKRNYNTLYGYGEQLFYSDYYSIYRRGGIAHTVVKKVATACWRDCPKIMQNDEPILEDEINELIKRGLFKGLERADILNRIGSYSVLLVGIPDGLRLDQPLGKANNFNGVYFQAYSEGGTTISKWDTDPSSPRYGMPVEYLLQTTQYSNSTDSVAMQSRRVHWTRVVHLPEGALDNPFDGTSSLEPCWNALIDKEKVRGGSGEAYFRNARQKFTLEAMKDAQIDKSTEGLATLRDEVEAFSNEQQDFMRLQNMNAKVMQPGMASPRDPFDIAVEEISGVTGIPIRVLTGKGGGQLAGSEDKAAWNAVVNDRQISECTDYLNRALEIFEQAGLLEIPDDAVIDWPVQPVLNELEAAKVTNEKAAAALKISDVLNRLGENASLEDVLEQAGFTDVTIEIEGIDDPELDDEEIPTS